MTTETAPAAGRLKNILVVEDEGLIAADLKQRLVGIGYSVPAIAKTADDAVRLAVSHMPDLILMDIRLQGGKDGIDAAHELHSKLDIPIVFVTAHADRVTIERAKLANPFGYIIKPFGNTDLRTHLEMAHAKHQVERKLRESEGWLSTTLGCVGDGIIATDRHGTVEFMNRLAEDLTGWKLSDAKGRLLVEVFEIKDDQTREAVLNPIVPVLDPDGPGRSSKEYRLYARNRSGSFRLIEAVTSVNRNEDRVIGAVLAFRDITDRRRLEEHVRLSQTQDATATMAGAFAHDFNNLLTVILGFTDVALAKSGAARLEVEEIRRAGEKATLLSHQLLTLSRKAVQAVEIIDLNSTIAANAKLLRQVLGAENELVLNLSASPCTIKANSAQVEQVLLNLATNARDAMPSGGRFEIRTGRAESGAAQLFVSDTGTGMESATRLRIFEPFFTRKEPGKGTGLGMAIVHSIVIQNGGTISVDSEPGLGTAFLMEFPWVEGLLNASTPVKEAAKLSCAVGRILLVEDDHAIRRLFHTQFEEAGFHVVEAESGEEALAILELQDEPIDVLVTDLKLPELTGNELARRVVAAHPEIRVLFVSGFSDQSLKDDELLASGQAEFVQKPLTPMQLLSKVNALCRKRTSSSSPERREPEK